MRDLAGPVSTPYPLAAPMRASILALLAALLPATCVRAEGVVVELRADTSKSGITVSWQLPPGFEESELLLEIEGGPRVRLTDELRDRHPRVDVILPALAGSARFVVRAGREDVGEGGGREEIAVARSERFALAGLPTTGRVPVRAAATRPVPGAAMEWWAEANGRPAEGPSPTHAGPAAAVDAYRRPSTPALASARPVPAASPGEASADFREVAPVAPIATACGARQRAFTGATTPLRD